MRFDARRSDGKIAAPAEKDARRGACADLAGEGSPRDPDISTGQPGIAARRESAARLCGAAAKAYRLGYGNHGLWPEAGMESGEEIACFAA
jgi:hypothetical protein